MLTVAECIARDERERDLYMDNARLAKRNTDIVLDGEASVHILRKNGDVKAYLWVDAYLFHLDAMICFLRRARLANRRIVQLRRVMVTLNKWSRVLE